MTSLPTIVFYVIIIGWSRRSHINGLLGQEGVDQGTKVRGVARFSVDSRIVFERHFEYICVMEKCPGTTTTIPTGRIPMDTIMQSDPLWSGTQEPGVFTIWDGTFVDEAGNPAGDATSEYTLDPSGLTGATPVTEPPGTTCSSGPIPGCYDGNTITSIWMASRGWNLSLSRSRPRTTPPRLRTKQASSSFVIFFVTTKSGKSCRQDGARLFRPAVDIQFVVTRLPGTC